MTIMILISSATTGKPIAYVGVDEYAKLSLASVANTRVQLVMVEADAWSENTDVKR